MPGGWEWLIIIAVLLLLFGAKRLPDMARSVGQSARVFKGEMKGLKDDEKKNEPKAEPAPAPAAEIPPAQPVTTNGAHTNGASVNQPVAPQDARPAGQ